MTAPEVVSALDGVRSMLSGLIDRAAGEPWTEQATMAIEHLEVAIRLACAPRPEDVESSNRFAWGKRPGRRF